MNNRRRKELRGVMSKLVEIKEALDIVFEEEEEYLDNIPENLQGSERCEKAEAAYDNLQDAVSSVEDSISSIEAAME